MTTQVLSRLKIALLNGERISTLDGLKRFGTIRLSEYIRRLRTKKGMNIETEMRYDHRSKKYYGVYFLKK